MPLFRKVLKFFRLPWARKRRLLSICWKLCVSVLLIKFVPFKYWKHRIEISSKPAEQEMPIASNDLLKAQEAGRRVSMIARQLPFPVVCLPQAMVTQNLLRRQNIPHQLCVGARAGKEQGYDFHAWVVCGGDCIIGTFEHDQFHAFKQKANFADGSAMTATGKS